jgi:hypothetical protein
MQRQFIGLRPWTGERPPCLIFGKLLTTKVRADGSTRRSRRTFLNPLHSVILIAKMSQQTGTVLKVGLES